MGEEMLAEIFNYLQLVSYLVLIIATIGAKIWLQHLSHNKISGNNKIFSRFALIIKNVPLYLTIEDIKK
jgi:hypothetical protein